jgi:tetratricopeptide (TPR) repeat protein
MVGKQNRDREKMMRLATNLGNLYANQGKLSKAEKMYERALQVTK